MESSSANNDPPILTRPPSGIEKILKDKYAESIAAQIEQMDNLGRQLIAIELAIPGLYATVLKLIGGSNATLCAGPALCFTFIFWFAALVLTLVSLIPRKWKVDRTIMKQDPDEQTGVLGIEDFFQKSAQYKRRFIIAASLLFFCGIGSAAVTVF